jgi:hypothetical protein
MEFFDLSKTLNENLSEEITREAGKSATEIDRFRHVPELNEWYQKLDLGNRIIFDEEKIIAQFETDFKAAVESFLLDDAKKIDAILICSYQLGSGLANCIIEGCPLSKKMILSSGAIPFVTDVHTSSPEYAMKLPHFEFLESFMHDKILNYELESEIRVIDKLNFFCIHQTRKCLFQAIERLDKKGVFVKIPHNNPLLIYFGEANYSMYSVYILEK